MAEDESPSQPPIDPRVIEAREIQQNIDDLTYCILEGMKQRLDPKHIERMVEQLTSEMYRQKKLFE